MIAALQAWSTRCTDTLSGIEAQIADIREQAERRQSEQKAWDEKLAKMVADAKEGEAQGMSRKLPLGMGMSSGTGGGGNILGNLQKVQRYGKRGSGVMDSGENLDDEAMDVDEEDEEGEGKKRSSRRKL